ncbi:ribonuclease III [Betaproteobacteria bacterium GR16-43]|nr:ribonuclease III [Betaproteobacteria bacterium GR16-43]
MPEALARLERALGHRFNDPGHAARALTHRSYGTPHNERLEFLGDSLLNCAVATILYERFPKHPEGDLSRLRAQLVKQASLFEAAQRLELGDLIRLGEGELKSGGHRRPSILADAVEALLGAVYLDGGFEAARKAVESLLAGSLDEAERHPVDKDPKTTLQEVLQGRKLPLPRYKVAATEGEAHDQTFIVECRVDELSIVVEGRGPSRRAAEQDAASQALQKLDAERKKARP